MGCPIVGMDSSERIHFFRYDQGRAPFPKESPGRENAFSLIEPQLAQAGCFDISRNADMSMSYDASCVVPSIISIFALILFLSNTI